MANPKKSDASCFQIVLYDLLFHVKCEDNKVVFKKMHENTCNFSISLSINIQLQNKGCPIKLH